MVLIIPAKCRATRHIDDRPAPGDGHPMINRSRQRSAAAIRLICSVRCQTACQSASGPVRFSPRNTPALFTRTSIRPPRPVHRPRPQMPHPGGSVRLHQMTPLGSKLARNRLSRRIVRAEMRNHRPTRSHNSTGCRRPDTARSPGDQHHFPERSIILSPRPLRAMARCCKAYRHVSGLASPPPGPWDRDVQVTR